MQHELPCDWASPQSNPKLNNNVLPFKCYFNLPINDWRAKCRITLSATQCLHECKTNIIIMYSNVGTMLMQSWSNKVGLSLHQVLVFILISKTIADTKQFKNYWDLKCCREFEGTLFSVASLFLPVKSKHFRGAFGIRHQSNSCSWEWHDKFLDETESALEITRAYSPALQ